MSRALPRSPRRSGSRIGDEAELANAYYNASFPYAVAGGRTPAIDTDRTEHRPRATSRSRATSTTDLGDIARRGECPLGDRQLPVLPRRYPGNGEEEFRQTLDMFRAVGDLTMEAWALHMLGTALLRNGEVDRGARPRPACHPPFPRRRRRRRADPDPRRPVGGRGRGRRSARAARLRGAARNLTDRDRERSWRGYVEDTFETGVRPGIRSHMSRRRARPLRRRGRGLTLDEAVAYALDGAETRGRTTSTGLGWPR